MNAVIRSGALALLFAAIGAPALAGDEEDLEAMLLDFLANVDERETHDRFWSEDLVYTSSAGLRFGKETIMEGFDTPQESPGATYGAEDIVVRVYGDTAVITFTLLGDDPAEGQKRYLNTGTFLKRGETWQVVAWQATFEAEE